MSLNPFKSDPVAALARAQDKLAGVRANIAALQVTRAEKLVTTESAEEILRIDSALTAERANYEIYHDKIKALAEEVRREEFQKRETQRQAAIEKISEKLKKREQIARQLELSLARTGHLFSELLENDDVYGLWPFSTPHYGWAALDVVGLRRELGWLNHGLCQEHHFPPPSNVGLGVVGARAIGAAELIRQQNANIIEKLSIAPLHNDLMNEDVA
jgi:multidrug efflux pump subunit AcrA (membrane-fusion protein)